MFANESEAYAESEAYDSASVVPIHTRSELSSDSNSAYDSASVASVNQPLESGKRYVQPALTAGKFKSCGGKT